MNRHIKYISLTLISLIVLCIGCSKQNPVIPPEEKPDTTSHEFTWEIDTIGEFQSNLYDVWGSENYAYAVGLIYWPDRQLPINIISWDGLNWTPVDFLEGYLSSIYGFDQNDIWVCGDWRVDNDLFALVGHWNGHTWKIWKLQQYNHLESIWGTSSSNIYTCGWAGTILHYNGSSWTKQESGTSYNLHDIWGTDNSNIFISGDKESTGEGVLLKFDGVSWKPVAKGSPQTDSTLYGGFEGVWCNSTEKIIHVGALVYEGTEGNWILADIPYNYPIGNINGLSAMRSVHGSKENNVFICGDYNLIIHWNGSTWHIYDQFFNKSKPSNLFGVWVNDKSVFIAGSENARAIIYRGKQ